MTTTTCDRCGATDNELHYLFDSDEYLRVCATPTWGLCAGCWAALRDWLRPVTTLSTATGPASVRLGEPSGPAVTDPSPRADRGCAGR